MTVFLAKVDISLTIGDGTGNDTVNLSEATLTNVTSVAMNNTTALTLSGDQVVAVGEASIDSVDDTAVGTLHIVEMGAQIIDVPTAYIRHPADADQELYLYDDEAHLLKPGLLEEIRLLTNFKMDSFDPFLLILSGQSDLKRMMTCGHGTFEPKDPDALSHDWVNPGRHHQLY